MGLLLRGAGAAGAFAMAAVCACGGSTSDPSPSTQQMITTLCDRFASNSTCGSESAAQKCSSDLSTAADQATKSGCQAQLDSYLACANGHAIGCEAADGDPLHPAASSACSAKLVAFSECYTNLPGECGVGVGVGSGTCAVMCADLSSRCTGPDPNGPVDCTCETGPRAGTPFTAMNCSGDLLYETGHNCR